MAAYHVCLIAHIMNKTEGRHMLVAFTFTTWLARKFLASQAANKTWISRFIVIVVHILNC